MLDALLESTGEIPTAARAIAARLGVNLSKAPAPVVDFDQLVEGVLGGMRFSGYVERAETTHFGSHCETRLTLIMASHG